MQQHIPRLFFLILVVVASAVFAMAQRGGITLYGDVKVDESKADANSSLSLMIVLYNMTGNVIGRQSVISGGRYRFGNLGSGEYEIGVEVDANEIARVRVLLGSMSASDYRQDLEFEWKPASVTTKPKAKTVSAENLYQRNSANESAFKKAQEALDKKKYAEATTMLQQVVDSDAGDFQAWIELGNAYMLQEKKNEAEKAYMRAIEIKPTFVLPMVNLGWLLISQKKFDEATELLLKAVQLQPTSAEINYALGEVYLQTRKGSKAVGYLNEAARLGKPDAHLRLATLYNAAGLKAEAALEYEQFLKKTPNYPDKKKLQQYITDNKK